jgi:hypothetical protein
MLRLETPGSSETAVPVCKNGPLLCTEATKSSQAERYEKRVTRRNFGPDEGAKTGGWWELHIHELSWSNQEIPRIVHSVLYVGVSY